MNTTTNAVSFKVELANGERCNLYGVARYIDGCRNTYVLEPQLDQQKAQSVARQLTACALMAGTDAANKLAARYA